MSHFSRVKTAFRDRSVLAQCLEEMGYQVECGGSVRGYHGVQKVDLAKGEPLKIDREVLADIREVFRTGRWKPSLHR